LERAMKIVETGILSHGEPGTARAALTFPSVVALSSAALLATLRAGSTKDAADETVELHRSDDGGRTWRALRRFSFDETIAGARGTLKVCYLTELAPGHLIAAAMWVDRTSYPGQPLFNPTIRMQYHCRSRAVVRLTHTSHARSLVRP